MNTITPETFAECQQTLRAELGRLEEITRLPGGGNLAVRDVVDRDVRECAVALVDLSAGASGVRLDSATAEDVARRVAGLRPEQAEGLVAELFHAAVTLASREAQQAGRLRAGLLEPAIDAVLRHLYAAAPESYLWMLAALAVA